MKIAKVGLLLGLVEKIPWNPEHGSVKAVLLIVFTVLLSFFVWQWKRNNDFSIGMVSKGCCNFEFHRRLFGNLERKNTKRKTKKKRTRGLGKVNQPHKIGGMGLGNMNQPHQVGKTMRKRMKPGRTRKDLLKKNPKIPQIFGVFWDPPEVGVKGLKLQYLERIVWPGQQPVFPQRSFLVRRIRKGTLCPCRMVPATSAHRAARDAIGFQGR